MRDRKIQNWIRFRFHFNFLDEFVDGNHSSEKRKNPFSKLDFSNIYRKFIHDYKTSQLNLLRLGELGRHVSELQQVVSRDSIDVSAKIKQAEMKRKEYINKFINEKKNRLLHEDAKKNELKRNIEEFLSERRKFMARQRAEEIKQAQKNYDDLEKLMEVQRKRDEIRSFAMLQKFQEDMKLLEKKETLLKWKIQRVENSAERNALLNIEQKMYENEQDLIENVSEPPTNLTLSSAAKAPHKTAENIFLEKNSNPSIVLSYDTSDNEDQSFKSARSEFSEEPEENIEIKELSNLTEDKIEENTESSQSSKSADNKFVISGEKFENKTEIISISETSENEIDQKVCMTDVECNNLREVPSNLSLSSADPVVQDLSGVKNACFDSSIQLVDVGTQHPYESSNSLVQENGFLYVSSRLSDRECNDCGTQTENFGIEWLIEPPLYKEENHHIRQLLFPESHDSVTFTSSISKFTNIKEGLFSPLIPLDINIRNSFIELWKSQTEILEKKIMTIIFPGNTGLFKDDLRFHFNLLRKYYMFGSAGLVAQVLNSQFDDIQQVIECSNADFEFIKLGNDLNGDFKFNYTPPLKFKFLEPSLEIYKNISKALLTNLNVQQKLSIIQPRTGLLMLKTNFVNAILNYQFQSIHKHYEEFMKLILPDQMNIDKVFNIHENYLHKCMLEAQIGTEILNQLAEDNYFDFTFMNDLREFVEFHRDNEVLLTFVDASSFLVSSIKTH